jgi:hypothetical protein
MLCRCGEAGRSSRGIECRASGHGSAQPLTVEGAPTDVRHSTDPETLGARLVSIGVGSRCREQQLSGRRLASPCAWPRELNRPARPDRANAHSPPRSAPRLLTRHRLPQRPTSHRFARQRTPHQVARTADIVGLAAPRTSDTHTRCQAAANRRDPDQIVLDVDAEHGNPLRSPDMRRPGTSP